TAVVLNPESRATELATLVNAADPSALVMDQRLIERMLPDQIKDLPAVALDDSDAKFFRMLVDSEAVAPPPASVDPDATAYILFTSGTTSRPKGVEISQSALFAQMATFVRQYRFDARTRLMNLLPLHHTDGLTQGVVVAACAGATLLRPMRIRVYQVGEIVDACHELRATHLVAVPSLLALMMSLGERYHDALRTDWFRFVISTAAYLDPGLWQRFEETYGTQVVNVYGLTETVCETTYCGPDAATRRIGTIGKPVDAEVRVVDEAGQRLPAGSEGELVVRGAHVMKGYFRAPEESARVLRDGWFHTGDLATEDADGFFRIVGRKKDVIITGGINVYPEDVNAVLRTVPGIVDAATIGLPDERWGEVVVSGLAVRAGAQPTEQDIAAHFLQHASPEKLPREFHFFEDLPRGPAGKVVKAELARLITERRATAHHEAHTGGVRERVLQVAAQAFKCRVDEISEQSTARTVDGWTSLAHVEFLMALEQEFDFTMQPEDILRIDSIGDALELLRRQAGLGAGDAT
ncbi:MAG TPA: AMP-binding protein, partial [Steroidobacteraceae bacterium]|nr:AMP-binding protein [Steroidobacteraceae bacterium]